MDMFRMFNPTEKLYCALLRDLLRGALCSEVSFIQYLTQRMPRKRTLFELYRHFCSTLLPDGGSGNPLCRVWESRRGGDTSLCGCAFDYGVDLLVEA